MAFLVILPLTFNQEYLLLQYNNKTNLNKFIFVISVSVTRHHSIHSSANCRLKCESVTLENYSVIFTIQDPSQAQFGSKCQSGSGTLRGKREVNHDKAAADKEMNIPIITHAE